MTTRRGFIGMIAAVAAAVGLPINRREPKSDYDPIGDIRKVQKRHAKATGVQHLGTHQGEVFQMTSYRNAGWSTYPVSHVSRIDRSMPVSGHSTLSIYGVTENGMEKCVFFGHPSACPDKLLEQCRRSGFKFL